MRSAPPRNRAPSKPPEVQKRPREDFDPLSRTLDLLPPEYDEPAAVVEESDRLVVVPLADTRCFGLMRENCPASADSPFVRTARHLAGARGAGADANALEEYYRQYPPVSAADVLGLPEDHEIADYPPMGAVLPWCAVEPAQYLLAMEQSARGYNAQHDMADYGVTDGHTQFGPVSRRMLRAEIARLRALVNSVREHGISDDHPPVLGVLLIDDRTGESRFDVRDGLHCCAVYAAWGYDKIPAQVVANLGPTTRRGDAQTWYHVQTGLFTVDEALEIFDRYFEGTL